MSEIAIEGHSLIPSNPILMIPNRLDLETLKALSKALGGRSRISWLVDESLLPDSDIRNYLSQNPVDGFNLNLRNGDRVEIFGALEKRLAAGRHVVLLCGRPAQYGAMLSDIPAALLAFLNELNLRIQPIYIGMFRKHSQSAICSQAPYDYVRIHFLPPLQAGNDLFARLRRSWADCAEELFAQHPMLQNGSLSMALLDAMMEHPNAKLIDGVDDSSISYREILQNALLLAAHLRSKNSLKRLGIILPPGKLATIANVACLLAGITAVNVNYSAPAPLFKQEMSMAGVNIYLTEALFVHKQNQFSWPRKRDLIYLDELIKELRGSLLDFKLRILSRIRKTNKQRIIRKLELDKIRPEDEACLLFTSGSGGSPKGVPLSQRMLLANLIQSQSRIQMQAGDSVLSALPLFHAFGYSIGMLLPLLNGFNMVTYPSPAFPKRLCQLIGQYRVRLTVSIPSFARQMILKGSKEQLQTLDYFITGGERLPRELLQEAYKRCGVKLLNGYGLTECSPVIATNLPPLRQGESNTYVLPSAGTNAVGIPLPGINLRITDPANFQQTLPPRSLGMLWLKGPNILSHYLGDAEADQTSLQQGWFRSGDVASIDEHGLLTIHGRKSRFSKIAGEMLSHEQIEDVLCRVLKSQTDENGRKLAIVGMEGGRKGEYMVLLSTLHQSVTANDLLTLRYGIMNEGFPALWCPERIIPVRSIPELANGKLDYASCLQIARSACLKQKR